MFLTLALTDPRRVAQGTVRLQLDWGRRVWKVAPGQKAWVRVGYSNEGAFEWKNNGVIWIWDKPSGKAKTTPLIIWDAPLSPLDILHKAGDGRLYDPKDPAMKEGHFHWTIEAANAGKAAAGPSALRDKAMGIINANLPAFPELDEPPNCVESKAKTKTDSGGTGCGGFPGWLIGMLGPDQFPKDKVKLTWTEKVVDKTKNPPTETSVTKSSLNGVTDPTIGWEDLAKAIEKRRGKPGSLWILYDAKEPNRRPKPGDIYTLKQPNGWFRHVGVMVDSTGNVWKTADGGQGQGFAVGFRARTFVPSTGELTGEDKKTAYLKGWVDLEALVEQPGA